MPGTETEGTGRSQPSPDFCFPRSPSAPRRSAPVPPSSPHPQPLCSGSVRLSLDAPASLRGQFSASLSGSLSPPSISAVLPSSSFLKITYLLLVVLGLPCREASSPVAAGRVCSGRGARASHHGTGSGAWGLQCLLLLGSRAHNNYSSWTELLHGLRDPPSSGIEPASPALAGGFFTPEPVGKPAPPFALPGAELAVLRSRRLHPC